MIRKYVATSGAQSVLFAASRRNTPAIQTQIPRVHSVQNAGCSCPRPVTLESYDATAVHYSGNMNPSCGTNTLTTRDGLIVFITNSGILRKDSNGNQISYSATAGWTDTLGRVIPKSVSTSNFSSCTGPRPIASAYLWSVPGPNGGTSAFKLCYVTVPVKSNFRYPSTSELNGTATMLQSVVLPDLTSWTFEYDSRDPGDPPDVNYADLTHWMVSAKAWPPT